MPGWECGVNSLQRVFSGQVEDYITKKKKLQSVCVLFFNAGLESKNTHSAIITLQDLNQISGSDINITCIILI